MTVLKAYRRAVHDEPYVLAAKGAAPRLDQDKRRSWPPAHADVLYAQLSKLDVASSIENEETGAVVNATFIQDSDIFTTVVPLLACDIYRPFIATGMITSLGGLVPQTSQIAEEALLQFLSDDKTAIARGFSEDLVAVLRKTEVSDKNPEARRLLPSLLKAISVLMSHNRVPEDLGDDILRRVMDTIENSNDPARLRNAVLVFNGLLAWRSLRREALSKVLLCLGHTFPFVRQATANALYIRFLEESEFEVPAGGGSSAIALTNEQVDNVCEQLTVTPWTSGEDSEDIQAVTEVLRSMYSTFGLKVPTSGRSILAPKIEGTKNAQAGNGNMPGDKYGYAQFIHDLTGQDHNF